MRELSFVYLVQHAEAKSEKEDPARPLSERGWKNARKMANYLSRLNIRVKEIYHSGKLRARQTAEVFAELLKPEAIVEDRNLSPSSDPKIWAEKLNRINYEAMLVGHLPHLSLLTSMLLCNTTNKKIVEFKNSGVLCLRKGENGWNVYWYLTPNIVIE